VFSIYCIISAFLSLSLSLPISLFPCLWPQSDRDMIAARCREMEKDPFLFFRRTQPTVSIQEYSKSFFSIINNSFFCSKVSFILPFLLNVIVNWIKKVFKLLKYWMNVSIVSSINIKTKN
jgi:hypothetical protein